MALQLASGSLFVSSDVWAVFAIFVGLDMTGFSRHSVQEWQGERGD